MKSQVDKSAFKYLPALLMIPTHFRLPFSQQFPGSVISQRAVPFFFPFCTLSAVYIQICALLEACVSAYYSVTSCSIPLKQFSLSCSDLMFLPLK